MKNVRRFLVTICFVVLVGCVFLPVQNRELLVQHWRGIFHRFEGPILSLQVTETSSPIIQLYRAKDDYPQQLNEVDGKRYTSASMRKIVNRYSDNAAALAYYLRTDRFLNFPLDDIGPLSSSYMAWSVAVKDTGAGSPLGISPISSFPTDFGKLRRNGPFGSKQEYESVLALIRRGQKLEPNNTYFDWILILALLKGDREQEAIEVVEKAWQKTDFNDHTNDEMVAMAAYSCPKGLHTEAKYFSCDVILLPHISQMRIVARHLAQHTMALRMYKRDAGALEWAQKCLSFTQPIRLKSGFWLTSTTGASIESIFLRHAHLPLNEIPIKPAGYTGARITSTMLRNHPYSLPYLARQLDKPQVAAKLEKKWDKLYDWRATNPGEFDGAVDKEIYLPLGWIQRANRYLLMSLTSSSILWIGLTLIAPMKLLPQLSTKTKSMKFWIGGGVVGLLVIAGDLACELFKIGLNPHFLGGFGYRPSQVLALSVESLSGQFGWRVAVGAIPWLFIWYAMITTGVMSWKKGTTPALSELSYNALAGHRIRFPLFLQLIDRAFGLLKSLCFFCIRWIAPLGILVGVFVGLALIPLDFSDENNMPKENFNFVCGVGLLILALVIIPALLLAGRVLLQRRPNRESFQIIPAFLWRAHALLGGFTVTALLVLAALIPIQARYTDKFNEQFAILERRETIPHLQSRGLLPND